MKKNPNHIFFFVTIEITILSLKTNIIDVPIENVAGESVLMKQKHILGNRIVPMRLQLFVQPYFIAEK